MSYEMRKVVNPTEFDAMRFADQIQDAVNLRAITARFVEHLDAMRATGPNGPGIDSDGVNNHPTTLLFVSKLVSLSRMSTERESAAFDAVRRAKNGETDIEYEVIPL